MKGEIEFKSDDEITCNKPQLKEGTITGYNDDHCFEMNVDDY